MTNAKTTRKALVSSMVALLICFAMLLGTTFAWFTDSVSSTNNIIKSGNLDVEVYYGDPANENSIKDVNTLFKGVALWEPGAVAYENLTVKNVGSLAFKYALSINFTNENTVTTDSMAYGLSTALKVAIVPGGIDTSLSRTELLNYVTANNIEWTDLIDTVKPDVLYPVDTDDTTADTRTYGIVIYWLPTANDNNWNVNNGKPTSDGLDYLHIDLGVNLIATQYTYEEDSFGSDYDADAASAISNGSGTIGITASAIEIHVRNADGSKVGSMVIPKGAIADIDETIEISYEDSDYEGNFTIDTGMETKVVDISVSNLAENNTTPIKAYIRIAAGLDPDTVKLYHYDTLIESTYNPETGYVVFETTTFSPFTVVYDAESKYVAPDALPEDLPKANVIYSSEYVNTDLPWGSYGVWSPTAGLDSQLEAAYTFSCTETLDEAKENPYANWYCDFVVVLNKDLGANEIFLGGNYGSFGWVGFHNGDLTLDANTEIPLLASVTTNPWTYLDVVQSVGTFICGVGDVDDALSGAEFTVMLRLTNPENTDVFYNVAEITYTFE